MTSQFSDKSQPTDQGVGSVCNGFFCTTIIDICCTKGGTRDGSEWFSHGSKFLHTSVTILWSGLAATCRSLQILA